ncbi:MAG: hypothetical protein HY897_25040 [Deltaproteobacteria bacterium]|nr:hypothetical protein [Deltaproteobacteria bacterium]
MTARRGAPTERRQWKLLPIIRYPEAGYARRLPRARQLIKHRDPGDAHPLALASALGLPLWTNDRDFEGLGVETFSTARLLAKLESARQRIE